MNVINYRGKNEINKNDGTQIDLGGLIGRNATPDIASEYVTKCWLMQMEGGVKCRTR